MNSFKQRGSALVAVLAVLGVVLVLGAVIFFSYVSAYNYGNATEQALIAQKDENRNKLAQYGQKVLEVAQVPEMYKNDVLEVTKAAIEGRYGQDGSKAAFQFLVEQNPSLDASLYKQIQQVIEAGRNDFQAGQTRLIDLRRSYQTALGSFWKGMWLGIAGYPKVKLSDFDIVSTGRADDAFKNKREDGPIQLRAPSKKNDE